MNNLRRTFFKFTISQLKNSPNRLSSLRPISSPVYQSSISLQNLYPNSSLKLVTPAKIETKSEGFSGYIPLDEITITYSRSSGPGGQNVNKVNTKVDIRFNVANAKWIDESIKEQLLAQNKNNITNEGFLIVKSDITRSQQLNLADALEKLRAIIRKAYAPVKVEPSQESIERQRKRHEKAVRERLMVKRHRSTIKEDRRGPAVDF
ncbi:peptidyl-tRNA hydrolase ICT1, mitochondrial [Ctenocephalides felis]|uniref:peptidyl-tRNA hydrolase ICT1, mitochondrial n=1 Tax=Ctenocephalides felis TaxID=7515 RepID=UPI000E6E1B49|nr:peptidyl-tRNA hydrolase ICT1, mitochondrial [Ctenocephalides felis]